MTAALRGWSWVGLLGGLALTASAQPANADAGPAVQLPAMTVTDSSLLPKPESWRYALTPEFEILANCGDGATQRTYRDLITFRRAIGVVWPALQTRTSSRTALILCGRGDKFRDFVPDDTTAGVVGTASLSLRRGHEAAIVLNLQTKSLELTNATAGNGAALDVTTMAGTVALNGGGGATVDVNVDTSQQLHREYVHFLFSRMNPRPAPWLEEGLAQLLASMSISKTEIVFGQVPDPNRVSTALQSIGDTANGLQPADPGEESVTAGTTEEGAFNQSLNGVGLMPLDQVFAVKADSPVARMSIGSKWSAECWLFVHMCLYGDNGEFKEGFAKFVARSQHEPITEDLFKQCFGKSYSKMLGECRSYQQTTQYKYSRFKGGHFPDVPDIALAAATDAQVGRIKGQALRLAGHKDLAHGTLVAPYVRGSRDPDLIAAIGLDDVADGRTERGMTFLDRAVNLKTSQFEAYDTLGKLRLEAAEAKPQGADGKLSTAQLIGVLKPVFAGRATGARFAEAYETIARAWDRSETSPSVDNLKVINEGVGRYPSDSELVYLDATLHARIGENAEAAKLADLGAETAPDAATKTRFASLKTTLPR